MEKIGDKIKRLMEARHWSEYQLETKSGVKRTTIDSIINGRSEEPKKKNLIGLAKAFKITYDELVSGTNLETPGQEPTALESYEELLERARLVAGHFTIDPSKTGPARRFESSGRES